MTSQLLKSKTIFLTIGVAGIVAAGSVMGATLKSEVDTIKVCLFTSNVYAHRLHLFRLFCGLLDGGR